VFFSIQPPYLHFGQDLQSHCSAENCDYNSFYCKAKQKDLTPLQSHFQVKYQKNLSFNHQLRISAIISACRWQGATKSVSLALTHGAHSSFCNKTT